VYAEIICTESSTINPKTIAKIKALDKRNPEDIDTHAEDHLYDALRYGIQSRPVPRNIFDLDPATSPKEQFKPADAVFGY